MKTSEKTEALYPCLFKALSSMDNVQREKKNEFFKSKYVPLDALLSAVRPVLSEAQLFLIQSPAFEEDKVSVETRVVHAESGQWISVTLTTPFAVGKGSTPTQAVGSAVSYLRRYGLFSLLGIAETDDDGNGSKVGKPDKKITPAEQWLEGVKPKIAALKTLVEVSEWQLEHKEKIEKLSGHPDVLEQYNTFIDDHIEGL